MQNSVDEQSHVKQSTRVSKFPARDGPATAKLIRKVIRAMVIFMFNGGGSKLQYDGDSDSELECW